MNEISEIIKIPILHIKIKFLFDFLYIFLYGQKFQKNTNNKSVNKLEKKAINTPEYVENNMSKVELSFLKTIAFPNVIPFYEY